MRFPNAAAGVKKIFTAEILALIAGFATILAAIGSVVLAAAVSDGSSSASAAGMTGLGIFAIFGLAAIILSVISFVLQILGINKAKIDEPSFKTALIFILVGIAASVIGGFFNNDTFKSLLSVVSNIASLGVTLCVIQGIRNLAVELNNNALIEKGNKILKLIAIMYGVILLANIVGLFAPVIAGVLAIIAAVISVVQYIFFLSYLSQAKKMLAA